MQQELSNDSLNQFFSFRRGEESGFTYFFKLYYRPALKFAISIIGTEPAAEDLVEESFIKLWEKRQAVQNASSIKSYLYTIIKNACLFYLKQASRESGLRKDMQVFSDEEVIPFDCEPLHGEKEIDIDNLLKQLPERQGQIFRMFYQDEKPIQQIALELNLSTGTVKNQKSRALQLLRNFFRNHNNVSL